MSAIILGHRETVALDYGRTAVVQYPTKEELAAAYSMCSSAGDDANPHKAMKEGLAFRKRLGAYALLSVDGILVSRKQDEMGLEAACESPDIPARLLMAIGGYIVEKQDAANARGET